MRDRRRASTSDTSHSCLRLRKTCNAALPVAKHRVVRKMVEDGPGGLLPPEALGMSLHGSDSARDGIAASSERRVENAMARVMPLKVCPCSTTSDAYEDVVFLPWRIMDSLFPGGDSGGGGGAVPGTGATLVALHATLPPFWARGDAPRGTRVLAAR